ncbi:YjjW family glycine radical enzyme activase [Paeniclostridium sp. NSJ-45]|uniref:YjjW family glycine radical enzyme activase n=1 Tax=Paeniclostridium hominis TaxID=2764329 RepID=A0ABR7K6C6_9FIRM|nr:MULTISPECIES: YjjW family glycine radical enzyme activase [Paeniclostridium]MBC6004649.1 YjjW family glycine radical enzyme activase [Paeniclostridium hominis]
MKAPVNKIINMSFIDGPGCRISVFLQGCNMKCIYCHNPETQNICISCKKCLEVCKVGAIKFNDQIIYDKKICINCDECIGICKNYASPKITYYTPNELFDYINKYKNFIDGITFSGGECTLYSDFIIEFTNIVHKKTNLNVFVDTNGYINENDINHLIDCVDGFMFDLKAFDNNIHMKVTGVENNLVLNNISKCSKSNKLYEIRTVLLENINDNENIFFKELNYIKNLNNYTKFKLIPFRRYGVKGELSNFRDYPKEKYMKYYEKAKEVLKDRMLNPII